MKFLYKGILASLLVLAISACDKLDENLNNPTEVLPEGANVELIYNDIQLEMAGIMGNMWYWPASLSRMIANTSAYDYQTASNPNSFNGIWGNVYNDLWADIEALNLIAENTPGLEVHRATSAIMKAYTMMMLVDVFNDVPYSEAVQGARNFTPAQDPAAEVYTAAEQLLNEAIVTLSNTTSNSPSYDNFFNGDKDKWAALARTLLLRSALNKRLVDAAGSLTTINSLIADPSELISSSSGDWEFSYGTSRENPNSRHPNYNNSYENSDGAYMSTYYMWLLRSEKIVDDMGDNNPANDVLMVDPRIRYYFYRQTRDAGALDRNEYSCHWSDEPELVSRPSWYTDVDANMPYCIVIDGDGYFGRDHMNNEGIPPDGDLRTVYGLYPFGGQFDDSSYSQSQTSGTRGAKGQGVWPMMLSSYVDFMRAEAALTLGTTDDARALLESGMRASFAKVRGFESRDNESFTREITDRNGTFTVRELYSMTDADVDAYVDFVLDSYDNATSDDQRLDILLKEYYITLWGNGIESYNMYRRTGKPGNMMPALEQGQGEFMTTFFYPSNHETRNPNVTQRQITDRVFWDNGSANVY